MMEAWLFVFVILELAEVIGTWAILNALADLHGLLKLIEESVYVLKFQTSLRNSTREA